MKALIADQKLVTELLRMEEAIEVMRRALALLAEGEVVMPLRRMWSRASMTREHRMRARGARGATVTRRRMRDRSILLVVAHGRQTATALADLTTEASTAAPSIVDLRWDAGADEFAWS